MRGAAAESAGVGKAGSAGSFLVKTLDLGRSARETPYDAMVFDRRLDVASIWTGRRMEAIKRGVPELHMACLLHVLGGAKRRAGEDSCAYKSNDVDYSNRVQM